MTIIRNFVILIGTFFIVNKSSFDVLADENDRNEAQCRTEFVSDCTLVTNPGCGVRKDDTIVRYESYCDLTNEYCRPGNKILSITNCPSEGDTVERDENTCRAQFSDCKLIDRPGCAAHVSGKTIRYEKYCDMTEQYCRPGNQLRNIVDCPSENN